MEIQKTTNENKYLSEYQTLVAKYNFEQFTNLRIDLSLFIENSYRISSGSFSYTNKGILRSDGDRPAKEVAIRYIYDADKDEDLEFDRYFFDEIRCHSSLKHSAILPLIGFSFPLKENDSYAIVQEFMPNGSLESLIEKVGEEKIFPENWETIKAINIFGIAAGMAFIHQNDIIHRDLKPKTVLLDKNFHPKIGGFNFSKKFKQGTEDLIEQTTNIGTLDFMAPEIFDDEHYSSKVDVYSYSILLHQLLTLRKTIHFVGTLAVEDGVRPVFKENEVSHAFVTLIEKCWSSDPDNRLPFISIVKEFIDNKNQYFDSPSINQEEFNDYIQLVTKDLDFSRVSDE
ncbi:hypothetical protein M9Y10_006114 [Tritrichomonas musculus]|uniref:Protein kinase domain-containing protein n=1 Tax=Tritrichomonas musculus TaxID=1915356 RepID=A0ABR2JEU0_9EUKA